MSKKDIIDYVMETPGNTNKKVLGRLIDEVEGVKLPEVTEDDNGSVLTVVEGAWDKAEPSGGSGAGVFMVEMEVDEVAERLELKATWQEIRDACVSGKQVIAYTDAPYPSGSVAEYHGRAIVDKVLYRPGESKPYVVGIGIYECYCNSPDERPNTAFE